MDGDEEAAEFFPLSGISSGAAAWQAEEHGRGWEIVAVEPISSSSAYDDCSIFPPGLHEGLHLLSPSPVQEQVAGLGQPSSPPSDEEEDDPGRIGPPISDSARRMVESGLELVRSKLFVLRGRRGGWSISALEGFACALLYLRRRHRREKELLLFLIQEKDQVPNSSPAEEYDFWTQQFQF